MKKGKLGKTQKATVFWHWTIGSTRLGCLQGEEFTRWAPELPQLSVWEWFPPLQSREPESGQNMIVLMIWGGRNQRSEQLKWLECQERHKRGMKCTDRGLQKLGGVPYKVLSWKLDYAYAQGESTQACQRGATTGQGTEQGYQKSSSARGQKRYSSAIAEKSCSHPGLQRRHEHDDNIRVRTTP